MMLRQLGVLSVMALAASAATAQFDLVSSFSVPDGAEIVDYADGKIVITRASGVEILSFSNDLKIKSKREVDLSHAFDAIGDTLGSVSSTAFDPAGRGLGVASLIPSGNGTNLGKVAFFQWASGKLLATMDVGFHPDSVKFSASGNTLFVVNEGEFTVGGDNDAPGSLTIIDLSSVTGAGNLGNATAVTYDFSPANLAESVTLSGLRFNDVFSPSQAFRHVEPEFLTQVGNSVVVSLQENNALAVFSTLVNKWTVVYSLGTISNVIDASDKDGGAFIDDMIPGLPMPDTIASFTKDDVTYIVTANEGDARPDDGDLGEVGDIIVDPVTEVLLNAIYGDYTDNAALGRLGISLVDGDTDGDFEIEVLTAMGTRSFSIWDASTGALVADSGSLENFLLAMDPARHNANDGGDPGEFDKRSDNKGPEPEGLDVIELPNGTILLAIGMERQNGIILADLTDPSSPVLIDYINSHADGLRAPESFKFIPAAKSPNGQTLLMVGYEGVDGVGSGVGIYSLP